MATFSPPGHATDLDALPSGREAWHATMATFFRQAIARAEASVGKGKAQFYDPTTRATTGPVAEQVIPWNGFPKVLRDNYSRPHALKTAEQLFSYRNEEGRTVKARRQDEYLEWFATKNSAGMIVAVDFTCEGPEYWTALAHGYPRSVQPGRKSPPAKGSLDLVLALYRKHVSPKVKLEELLYQGRYDPRNKWNTTAGAMHLTHPANSLQAEVFLAADATVLRQRAGQVLEDDDELIRCAGYGEPGRSSDPRIGGDVNSLARAGALVSLRDPVGLYIDSLDTTGWTAPNGSPVDNYWKVVRGTKNAILRARYEVPKARGYVVGEILIGGEPIAYAGQIAERITIKLTGTASETGKHRGRPVACLGAADPPPPADDGAGDAADNDDEPRLVMARRRTGRPGSPPAG